MDRNSQHYNYLRSHLMRSRWYRVFIAAAAIVVFITTYMLILPAITLDAKCGKEEHKHTETCYQVSNKLTCTKEETPGHTHTEACYQTTDIISCGLEESDPVVEEIVNEETGETETVVVSEGHIHNANCYTQETNLICGQEECEAHTHAKDCYKEDKKLTCDKEEHKHTESCYHEQSDPNADLENEAIWTQTFAHVQLTGNWSEDVAAIAKTQVGYKESAKNFIYDKDDEKDGYTRYGAWYGDPYGEWCAMFASFNIYYAQVGQDELGRSFPLEANCAEWISKLQQLGYYHEAANSILMDKADREAYTGNEYCVKPGDLIFFNLDNSQYVVSDHVGIVSDVTANKISTIQGNSNGAVVEKDYSVGDVKIVGFGEIPENPNYVDPDKKTDDEQKTEASEATETPKKKSVLKRIADTLTGTKEETKPAAAPMLLSDDQDPNAGIAPVAAGAADMTPYITGITVSRNNGGRWQESNQFQSGDRAQVNINFDIPANVVTQSNPSIYYNLPGGLLKPNSQMNGFAYDGNQKVGTYEIVADEQGNAQIVITYYPDFADGNSFTGNIFFNGEIALGEGQSQKEYDFAGTNTHITVKGQDKPYDVRTEKTATLSADASRIDYVVKVSTNQGTDGEVVVKDTLYKDWNGDGSNVASYSGNVTIKKYDASGTLQSTETKTPSGNSFEYTLPELSPGQYYQIEYSATPNTSAAADDGSLTVKNTAQGTLKDHPDRNSSQETTTTVSGTKIEKYGSYNQNTGKMEWTIVINNPSQVDLNNKEVVDLISTDGVTINSNPVVTDASGNVITNGILSESGNGFTYKFPSGSTSDKYTIKYTSTAPAGDGAQVNNTATYKGDGNKDYTASSNPSVYHRTFGMNKSVAGNGKWKDENGVQYLAWQTYLTLPDTPFPQEGYFYEDTILDATQNGQTFPGTHYSTRGLINYGIMHDSVLKIFEDGQEKTLTAEEALNNYINIEIKYYNENGDEITDWDTPVKRFTVKITPKDGKEFIGTSLTIPYSTIVSTEGFTEGVYIFKNDGAIGDTHSTPQNTIDFGHVDVDKKATDRTAEAEGYKYGWKSTVSLPNSPIAATGVTYEDVILDAVDEQDNTISSVHYAKYSDLTQEIRNSIKLKIGGEEKSLDQISDLVDVEIRCYTEKNGLEVTDDTKEVKYFTVKVTPKSGQSVIAEYFNFTYSTHGKTTDLDGGIYKFKNTGIAGTHESTAEQAKRITAAFEKSVYTGNAGEWTNTLSSQETTWDQTRNKYTFSSKDGTVVNYDQGIITYRILVKAGFGQENDQDITIVDTLPEGLEYVEGSADATVVQFWNMDGENFQTTNADVERYQLNNYNLKTKLSSSISEDKKTITLNLPSGYASDSAFAQFYNTNQQGFGYIGFYYQAKITDPAWDNDTIHKKTYVNSATWQQKGNTTSQSTTITKPIEEVSKFAESHADDMGNITTIDYYVTINPGADDLDPNNHEIELVDTMNSGIGSASLDLQSVVLYEYNSNAEHKAGTPINTSRYRYHYDANQKQLTIAIPDELACVLKYTYNVSSMGAAENYDVSNRVSLHGKNYESNKITMETQDSGSTAHKSKITLYKVDKDNYGKRLAGVKFQLAYLGDSDWILYSPDEGATSTATDGIVVTNENGQILFDNSDTEDLDVPTMHQNTLYRLVEKENPNSGYAVDDTPFYLVWLDGHTTADDWYNNKVSGKTYYHGDVAKADIQFFEHAGASIYIENEYKNIAVKKVWVDEDGKDLINHPNEITVELYESTKTRDVVKVTTHFVDPTGNEIKSYESTMGRGSSCSFNWYQPVLGTITTDKTVEYDLSSNERGDRTLTIGSVTDDLNITIMQGTTSETSKKVGVAMADGSFVNTYYGWDATYSYYVEYADGSEHTSGDSWYIDWQKNKVKGNSYQVEGWMYDQGKTVDCYDPSASNPYQTYEIKRKVGGYTESTSLSQIWDNMIGQDVHVIDVNATPKYQIYTIEEKEVTSVVPAAWEVSYATISASIPESEAPESVSEGKVVDTITLNSSNNWNYAWGDSASSYKLKANCYYYVKETSIGGKAPDQTEYTVLYQNNNGIKTGEILVTNRIPKQEIEPVKTEITIEKKWKDPTNHDLSGDALQGKQATFRLMQVVNGNVDAATEYTTFTLPENNSWSKTFDNLNKTTYDSQGNATHYKYYFEETSSTGTTEPTYQKESIWNFLPWVNGSENAEKTLIDAGSVTVTNKLLPEKTTVSVEKKWLNADGSEDRTKYDSDASVTVDLYKIDNGGQGAVIESGITLNKGNSWKAEKTDLTKEEYINGVKHTYGYYFVETKVSGYQTSYKTADSQEVTTPETIAINVGTVTVINKQQLKDSVTVTKQWFKSVNGNTTQIYDRTGSISFDLYRLATKTGSGDGPDVPVDPGETTCEHSWGDWETTKEPTETEAGEQKRTCSKCYAEETQSINPTDHTHNYDDGPVTTPATCSSTGVRTFTCSGCGDTYTQEVPVDSTNHTGETYTSGYVAPTTTTAGKEADTYCKGCNVKIADGAVIPATGGGGSSDPVLVEFHQDWSGGTLWAQGNVIPNKPAALTVTFVGITNYTPDLVVNGTNASKSAEYINSENQKCVDYTFTFTVDSATTYILGFGAEWTSLVNWNVSNVSTRAATSASARSLMSAPRLASAPASETPTIPSDAVKVGTFQIHSDSGWTFTKEFDAEPGYTYTYYVVETGNDNVTTTYVGEGTSNITINNTIVENSYELPHTGGRGTKLITMLGILLMAAASSLMILKKHRKEEIW